MCPGEIREVNIPSHLGFGDEEKGKKKKIEELNRAHWLLDDCIGYIILRAMAAKRDRIGCFITDLTLTSLENNNFQQ